MNRTERAVLVNLNSLPGLEYDPVYPLGLASVASSLRQAGVQVDVVDFLASPELVNSFAYLKEPCDLLGFHLRNIDGLELGCAIVLPIYQKYIAEAVASARSVNPDVTCVIGGPGYSLYANALEGMFDVDIGIVGPGESSVRTVARTRRSRGQTRSLLQSLQKSPVAGAAYSGFTDQPITFDENLVTSYIGRSEGGIGIQTQRGRCPRRCDYCSYGALDGPRDDRRELDALEADITSLYELGVRELFFADAVFNGHREFAKDVCRRLIRRRFPDLKWQAYAVPTIDEEFIELSQASGCSALIVSTDSFSDTMLRNLRKGFNTQHLSKFIDLCHRHAVPLSCSVLFGGPGECEETVVETCSFINDNLAPGEFLLSFGLRMLPASGLARYHEMSELELLYPIHLFFTEKVFDWVCNVLQSSHLGMRKLIRLTRARSGYRTLNRVPISRGRHALISPEAPVVSASMRRFSASASRDAVCG